MARSSSRKRPGIFVERELIVSPAFHQLSGSTIEILFSFLLKRQIKLLSVKGKRQSKTIANNGSIVFTYEEAREYGFSPATFSGAIRTLVERGFVSVARPGGLTQGSEKLPTLFRVHVLEGMEDQPWKRWRPTVRKHQGKAVGKLRQFREPTAASREVPTPENRSDTTTVNRSESTESRFDMAERASDDHNSNHSNEMKWQAVMGN